VTTMWPPVPRRASAMVAGSSDARALRCQAQRRVGRNCGRIIGFDHVIGVEQHKLVGVNSERIELVVVADAPNVLRDGAAGNPRVQRGVVRPTRSDNAPEAARADTACRLRGNLVVLDIWIGPRLHRLQAAQDHARWLDVHLGIGEHQLQRGIGLIAGRRIGEQRVHQIAELRVDVGLPAHRGLNAVWVGRVQDVGDRSSDVAGD
jgi:hypothetical protein